MNGRLERPAWLMTLSEAPARAGEATLGPSTAATCRPRRRVSTTQPTSTDPKRAAKAFALTSQRSVGPLAPVRTS